MRRLLGLTAILLLIPAILLARRAPAKENSDFSVQDP